MIELQIVSVESHYQQDIREPMELSTLIFLVFLFNIVPLTIVFSSFARSHAYGDLKGLFAAFVKAYPGLCISFIGSILVLVLYLLVSLNLLETYADLFLILTNITLTFLIVGILVTAFRFLAVRYVTGENPPAPAAGMAVPASRPAELPDLKIFISYRRSDSADVTGRIYDRLAQHFGTKAIFKDVDDIPLGVDFRKKLDQAISECNRVIIVIGREWLTTADENGVPRLQNKADFVRIEIESALRRAIPVIPILVGSAQMPNEHDLPDSLKDLAFRHGTSVRPDPDFHKDMDRLIAGIQKVQPESR